MSLLLQTEHPNTLSLAEIQQLNDEDRLLNDLKAIRNKLAHHPTLSVTAEEFQQLWTSISQILLTFGDVKSELDRTKDDNIFESHGQPIDEESVKEAYQLNSLGTQAHKEKKFTKAINLFTRAIDLAGVSNDDRAIFYSNLSSTRLALYEQQQEKRLNVYIELCDAKDQRYRALQDAKQARHIRTTWWKGHFRVGKVYAVLNEYNKAIRSFERAFALSPTNDEIQKALNQCRSIYSRQSRQDHLDPRWMQGSIPEQLKEAQKILGVDLNKLRTVYETCEEMDPVQAIIRKAKQYLYGDGNIQQNYEKAAECFAEAANQGNAEGMYNLACMVEHGVGAPKDHNLAHKLLEQAAAQPPEHPIFIGCKNIGVAEAEHALGLYYAEGIVVHKDLPSAACWYQRAVEHGNADAANNLAIMYESGTGVTQDFDKAIELFELAARRGDPNAMLHFAEILLHKGNLQMAQLWYDRACDAGNIVAQTNRAQFEKDIKKLQKPVDCSTAVKIDNMMRNFFNLFKCHKSVYKISDHPHKYDYNVLNEYAQCGSKTAQILCSAMEHYFVAMMIIRGNGDLSENQENMFVHELSRSYRLEHIVAAFLGTDMRLKTNDIVDRVLERCTVQSNASISELDEDVRICYAVQHMDSFKMINLFLLECIKKYPQTILFFHLCSEIYGWLEQYEQALYISNKGLEINPNYCELLYNKAVSLRLLERDANEAVKAYEAFLAVAAKDHRKVPESYYAIANCYAVCDRHKSMANILKETYEQGQEAEKLQLPCSLPYESNSKGLIKILLNPEILIDDAASGSICRKQRLTDPHRIELITKHRE